MAVLREDGSAIDVVVAGVRLVEANPLDHSIGYSGLPNHRGEVGPGASLMDGWTLATGVVGALRGYQGAILLAGRAWFGFGGAQKGGCPPPGP